MKQTDKTTIESYRIRRECKTIGLMIRMYCRATHGKGPERLCPKCEETARYAQARIDECRFRSDKPTCVKCPVHCYSKAERENIKRIMRFSGPRMLVSHPVLAILHLKDTMSQSTTKH
jgi:hypothetical protein